MIFLTLLVILLAIVIWYRFKQRILSALPAHFPSVPLLGSFYYLSIDPVKQRKQFWDFCYYKHRQGGICALWMGTWPFVLIYKAEFIQDLLNSHEIRKALDYKFAKPWLGEGLITGHGDHWYKHRKLLTPSFHFGILNEFLPVMSEHAETFLSSLEKYASSDEEVDVFPLVTLLTLDIICETAMGQSLDAQKGANVEYVKAVIDINKIIDMRFKSLHLWPDIFFRLTTSGRRHAKCLDLLHSYSRGVIENRATTFDRSVIEAKVKENLDETEFAVDDSEPSKGKLRVALLDTLLYASDNFTKLSRKEIQEEVDTFLFAGHDTTAICLAWTLYLLSVNPEAQRKVHNEVDTIFGSSSRFPTVNDLRQMKYIECCVKESLRIFPSVPLFARELMNDIKIGPYVIPKGSGVIALLELLNHDPDYFVDPFAFHPERFASPIPDSLVPPKSHPFAFIPFAAGQRNCIGQRFAMLELKVVLSTFFRRFSVTFSDARPKPTPIMELLFRPDNGIFLKVHHR